MSRDNLRAVGLASDRYALSGRLLTDSNWDFLYHSSQFNNTDCPLGVGIEVLHACVRKMQLLSLSPNFASMPRMLQVVKSRPYSCPCLDMCARLLSGVGSCLLSKHVERRRAVGQPKARLRRFPTTTARSAPTCRCKSSCTWLRKLETLLCF